MMQLRIRNASCKGPQRAAQQFVVPHLVVSTQVPSGAPMTASSSQTNSWSSRPVASVQASTSGRRALVVRAQAGAANKEVQISVQQTSVCGRRVSVTVPGPLCQSIFHQAVNKLQKQVVGNLPGFRNDKPLPLGVIVQNVGGQRKFKMFMIEEILLQSMEVAMEKVMMGHGALVPGSERFVTDAATLERAFDPAKPLHYEVDIEVAPPLKWKQSYRGLEVTIKDTGDLQTDMAATEGLIRQALKKAGFSRVAERGLERGDTAIFDLEIRSLVSKEVLPGMSKAKAAFDTEADPLDLTAGMLGMKAGETRTFPVVFPDDYGVELWQGMQAEATVTVREVFMWVLPKFDDGFVAKHHPEFASAEEMRSQLLKVTAMERIKALDEQLEDAVMTAVTSIIEVAEVPSKLTEELGIRQFNAALMKMIQDRVATPEEVENMYTGAMVEEYISKHKPELEAILKYNMAVDEIAKAEGITVAEADVQAEFEKRVAQLKAEGQEFSEEILRGDIRETFLNVQVTEWLKDNLKRHVIPWNDDSAASASSSTSSSSS